MKKWKPYLYGFEGYELGKSLKQSQYLGDVHYRDADGRDVVCRGAVLCGARSEFDDKVSDYLQAQGAAFLWSEEVHEALSWFNKFGHNGMMAGLAKRVSDAAPVALSDPKASYDNYLEHNEELRIEELDNVVLLDMQIGVYPKLTVPAELQEILFGQPEPTEAEIEEFGDNVPPMGTYVILDAAKMPYLLTGELAHSGLEYQSLFQGVAQEELGEHAPYIVKLEDGNDFTRKLFTDLKPPFGLWEKELGIFFISRLPILELRKLFRKKVKIRDNDGKWYFQRFWEGEFFLYIYGFMNETRWFYELRSIPLFIVPIEGVPVSVRPDYKKAVDQGSIEETDMVFTASEYMVGLRHLRNMERKFPSGLPHEEIYQSALDMCDNKHLDYDDMIMFIDIIYVLRFFYGEEWHYKLNREILDSCFDENGLPSIFLNSLHGQCMFAIINKIEPHNLKVIGGIS